MNCNLKSALDVSQGDIQSAANTLGVSRKIISLMLNGKANVNTRTGTRVINYFKQLKQLRNNLKEA